MKRYVMRLLLLLLIGCRAEAQTLEVRIDHSDRIEIKHYIDKDMIRNKTGNEGRSLIMFQKPIMNVAISIDDFHLYDSLDQIAGLFKVRLQKDQAERDLQVYQMFSLVNENIRIVVFKVYDGRFYLLMIEYTTNSEYYAFQIHIGATRSAVVNILGQPSYYSDSVYMYKVFRNVTHPFYPQTNVYFDQDGKAVKVQVIGFDDE